MLSDKITTDMLADEGTLNIRLNNQEYLVSYVKSTALDWVLVDYVPLEEVLAPINFSRYLFYSSICLILLLSFLAALLLYRQVHLPIRKLVTSITRFKKGNYATRIHSSKTDEFHFLMVSFNLMASQIQQLIEEVYEEKIRLQEATLKQLQAQINPHFLYNCLFYIKNMAKTKNTQAIEAMSLHLGHYYRYMTRTESVEVSVGEELQLVRNYLDIHVLRKRTLSYDIDVDSALLKKKVPRLLLQPIVENAIIHGIEPEGISGAIRITGASQQRLNRIIVEDNGGGLGEEELVALRQRLEEPMREQGGCGIWNVHQRLRYQFEQGSGLFIERSDLGGLRFELIWSDWKEEGNVPAIDRGR